MDIKADHITRMLSEQRMEIVLRFGFVDNLYNIPLAGQQFQIELDIRVTHAADAETVDIGCTALADLVAYQLGQF